MTFIEYINTWVKNEVSQGRTMMVLGVLLAFALYGIIRNNNELLRGTLIPLSLLILILIGYGSYILYSRPVHAKESIALFKKSELEAITKEKEKHINDNKAGNTLITYVYPALIILAALGLVFSPTNYLKGMTIGFILLFVATYIIDYGFVSRSNAFLSFLNSITSSS